MNGVKKRNGSTVTWESKQLFLPGARKYFVTTKVGTVRLWQWEGGQAVRFSRSFIAVSQTTMGHGAIKGIKSTAELSFDSMIGAF